LTGGFGGETDLLKTPQALMTCLLSSGTALRLIRCYFEILKISKGGAASPDHITEPPRVDHVSALLRAFADTGDQRCYE